MRFNLTLIISRYSTKRRYGKQICLLCLFRISDISLYFTSWCLPTRGFLVHETSSSVSVVPREIEDSLCNIFSVPVLCRGHGRGRWGGVGEVLHVWWVMWKWWICLYTEQRWVCSIHFIVIIQVEICLYLVRRGKLLGVIITSDLSWNDHVNERLRSILVYARLFSFMLCPSIYRVGLSGSKQGHYQSFSPVCLMTRHLMKPVFQPLFHIARTYVSTFLTLPTATGITNLITSYY